MAIATETPHSPNSTPQLDSRRVNLILAVLVVSAMVMILNETILSVALPHIMEDFAVTADVAQWLTTGFMLTMAVVIPTTGFMLQRFPIRRIFFAALGLFTAGSLMAALAPAFWVLLAGRVVQAGGTAIVLPLLMTVTLTLVAPERRGTMMGINSIVISVAPAIGPTLSGIILASLTWHWLFWIMVPIAVIALVAGAFLLIDFGETEKISFDVLSVILSAFAFGGIVYGLSSIGQLVSGESAIPLYALIFGLVVLAVFVWRQISEEKKGRALLNLKSFKVTNFTLSVVVVVMAMAMMLGTVLVLPIYLQTSLGVSALVTGLLLLPGGLIQGVISPFIGRVYDNAGPRPLVIPGALLMLIGQLWLHLGLSETTSTGVVVAMHVVFCIGMAMVMTPLMTLSLSSLPMDLYGHGSAILNTLQQLGGAAGTAILVAAMTIGAEAAAGGGAELTVAQAAGANEAFLAGAVLAVIALIVSPLVKPLSKSRVVETTDVQ